jgi:division protein CdvB (Snf7/Vps24/ESCRT-III family)
MLADVSGTSAASDAGGPLRSLAQLRHLSDRVAAIERRLDEVERRLATPECDGTALEAVRDAVREIGTEVTEELNRLAADRTPGHVPGAAGTAQG